MRPKVSIILIREHAGQMTGSGCCGKLEGDNALTGGGEAFGPLRARQREFGVLHRAVRKFFGDPGDGNRVSIVTVDPRNQLYLMPKLFWDVVRYRPGWRAGLAAAMQIFSPPVVVVNGRVLNRKGETVDPDTLCHMVTDLLNERAAS